MPFDTDVVQIDSTTLENLFQASPEGSPNANTLESGKQTADVLSDIPYFEDIPPEETVGKTKTPEQIAAEKKAKEDKEKPAKTPEELQLEKDALEKKTKEDAEKKAKEDGEAVDPEQVKTILKNTVNYLVEKGHWEDFDGREDLEITEDLYADLAAKQDEFRLTSKFNDLVESTGDYGKAIINHIKNGGNPDDVIDIFKQQFEVDKVDTATETGKQKVIEKYYSEVLGWKPEKIEKTIKRLVTDNEIDAEFTDTKELYDKHFKAKVTEIREKADHADQQRKIVEKDRKTAFEKNIKTALDSDASISTQEKKILASSILDFKHQLDNGQKVNDFYVKFAEMQADPKEYIKLVRFVMNPKKFEKQIEAEKNSEAAINAFKFIKGNAAVGKKTSNTVDLNDQKEIKAYKGTDFSFAAKR